MNEVLSFRTKFYLCVGSAPIARVPEEEKNFLFEQLERKAIASDLSIQEGNN